MIRFQILDQRYDEEALGLIPDFLATADGRFAAQQFDDRYSHGGGWQPMSGWSMGPIGEIMYPGEEALPPIAVAVLGHEIIRVYASSWVSITQPDGSFEVSKMD